MATEPAVCPDCHGNRFRVADGVQFVCLLCDGEGRVVRGEKLPVQVTEGEKTNA